MCAFGDLPPNPGGSQSRR